MNIFGLEIKKQLKMSATQSSSQVKPEQKKVYAAEKQVGGYLEDQYEASSSLSLDDLLSMRKDPTIKIALWFYSTIILSGFGDYTHPNEEVQKFVRENMERINLKRKLTKMLSFRWIGASVSEIVWDYIDGKYQITDLVYLKPETWYDNGLPLSEVDPIKQVLTLI